ncbi:glycosyltransferase [Akkermansiaceae bacterium]|nr:glycosyltransferase [Akkermansiaceae bacterium]MDB4388021.1 glycosyltransferase [Akkermansiaceae bacterium]MDB4467356.1 glycosyltransferase [Akkermansiaceae bacterium]
MARIQIVSTDEHGGGNACEALWYEMAESALAAGHQVDALVSQRSHGNETLSQLSKQGMDVRYRAGEPSGGRIKAIIFKFWQRTGAKYCSARKLDADTDFLLLNVGTLVEAVMDPWYGMLMNCDRPVGIIVHNNPEIRHYPSGVIQRLAALFHKADRVWFVSQRLKDNAEEQTLMEIPGARVARNPVNLENTGYEPWPHYETLRLAVVGRLDAYVKGQVRLLHALSDARWQERDWTLTIFGSGPDEEKVRKAAEFYGLEERVKFGGFVKNIRQEIWAKHHALVMPSMLEGMPLTLVEAMVCGRPAICSDVGGASELVEDGVNGFLAGSPFAGQLDLALERMWKRRDELIEMGRKAHESAAQFLPQAPGEQLLAELLECVDQ